MAKDYNQLLDDVFSAVDVITQKRIESLDFNKTVKCSIVNNINADKGEYTVTDGSATFLAYSEKKDYKIGAYVYVLIPNGDYAQQKMIVGKYVTVDSEYYTYVKPSDAFINITDNLVSEKLTPVELTANSETEELVFWSIDKLSLSLYDRLFIKCDFQTWLSNYHLDAGDYGIKLIATIWHKPDQQKGGETFFKEFELNTSMMYGDPYNFETYYSQEGLFDISTINDSSYQITGFKLIAFQKGNFAKKEKLIPVSPTSNIFIKNPIIALGYSLESFKDDSVLLGTFNGTTYSTYLTEERKQELGIQPGASPDELAQYISSYNAKNIYTRWVHETEIVNKNGKTSTSVGASNFVAIQNENKMPAGAQLHWYRYCLNEGVRDELAGAFWVEMPEYKNKFNITGFQPDISQAFDQIKVIIEQPTREALDEEASQLKNYQQRKIYADTYVKFKDDEIGLHNAIVGLGLSLSNEEFEDIAESFLAEVSNIYSKQILYESPILTFTNEAQVADKATWDLIKGLTLEVDQKGYKGVYRIYDELGNLYSSGESVKKRIITAKYTSLVTGQPELDTAEEITWTIPTRNTMIYMPEDGIEFDLNHDKVTTDADDNIIITRYGVVSSSEPGSEEADTAQQYFRIKDHYSQTLVNNTIHCKLVKNNVVYETDAVLTFGPAGTNGTDYTMTLEFKGKHPAITISQEAREYYDQIANLNNEINLKIEELNGLLEDIENDPTISRDEKDKKKDELDKKYQESFDEIYEQIHSIENKIKSDENASIIYVIPHIYDFEGRDITTRFNSSDFKYDWFTQGSNGIKIISSQEWTEEELEENAEVGAVKLKASSDIESCQWYVLRASLKNAATVAGDTTSRATITLNAYLPIPVRFSQDYTAFDGADKIAYNSSGVMPQYYKDPYKLYTYEAGLTTEVQGVMWNIAYGDPAAATGSTARFYPRVTQDGKITVPSMYLRDIDNRICVNAYLGSQLVWTQPLYIFQNVYESAMLNAWDGSLTFDEENGTILSAMVGAGKKNPNNTFSGVLMGQLSKTRNTSEIGLYGYDEGVQSFGLNIDGTAFFGATGNGRIEINGKKGTIASSNYENNSQGMKIDLNEGVLTSKHNLAMIKIDPTNSSGYFKIVAESGNTLTAVGSDGYYLQSDNYSMENKTGTKLDLQNGNLKGYDFTLESAGHSDNSRIRLSTQDPYFLINASSGHTLIQISDGAYYLQSDDYSTGEAGTKLDLQTGALYAYGDFTLQMGGFSGKHFIISNRGSFAIDIKGDGGGYCQIGYDGSIYTPGFQVYSDGSFIGAGGYFMVDKDGKMFCTNGEIGGWEISPTVISNNHFELNAKDGTIGSKKSAMFNVGKDGGKIGGWEINEEHIKSSSGDVKLTCDGGIIVTDGEVTIYGNSTNCYFKLNNSLSHPEVSGLNVTKPSNGISFRQGSEGNQYASIYANSNGGILSGGNWTIGAENYDIYLKGKVHCSLDIYLASGHGLVGDNGSLMGPKAIQAVVDAYLEDGHQIASRSWVLEQIASINVGSTM